VLAAQLKLAPGQPVKSGLGTQKYLEFENEPNGWWSGDDGFSCHNHIRDNIRRLSLYTGRNAYFAPYELAAFYSAVYDGHAGAMGAGMGVSRQSAQQLHGLLS
jgi:hypothetical protein